MWIAYALISPFFYALTNILDSLFMKNYEKDPVVYLFFAGLLMSPLFFLYPYFLQDDLYWIQLILITTLVGYLGDLFYFRILHNIDVSVMNASWAILAIFVSIGGFLLFKEQWSPLQVLGSFCVIGGVFYLSYSHHYVSLLRTLFLFSCAALFYTPIILVAEAAIQSGMTALTALYWSVVGRNVPNLLVPLTRKEWRKGIVALPKRVHGEFYILVIFAILIWFGGVYSYWKALEFGFVSLVAVVTNVQPFFVILQCRLISVFLPRYTPRELLTAQSVQVKLRSFAVVFAGLALLAIG